MDLKVVHKLFDNVQNLKSYEDIATAALVTMFEVSDTFTTKFHEKVFGKKNHQKSITAIKELCSDGYWVGIGDTISNKNYKWLDLKPKTSFKPDIWLSTSEFEPAGGKVPAKTGHFLIESKYGNGCLTAAQEKGYPQMAGLDKFGPVLRLLIHTKKCELKEYGHCFDETITWADLVKISNSLIDQETGKSLSEAESIILEEILDFLKFRLAPEFDLDDYSGTPLEKEAKLLHDILSELRNRLGLRELIYPKEWKHFYKKDDFEYWCLDDKYLKQMKVGESKRYAGCDNWISAVKTNRNEYLLRFESWTAAGGEDQPANMSDLKSIKLRFSSRLWIDEWFKALQEVERFIETG